MVGGREGGAGCKRHKYLVVTARILVQLNLSEKILLEIYDFVWHEGMLFH